MFPKNLKRQKKVTTSKHPLYKPSVYTFSCRGAYHASSESLENREGSCRGFRSRLELLSDMEMNTRKGALEDFTYWAAGGDMDNGYDLDQQDGTEQLDPKTKSVLVSPALIYRPEQISSPSRNDQSSGRKSSSNDGIIEKGKSVDKGGGGGGVLDTSSMLPEEELIQRQDWKCYGSTQVDYLLLTNPETGQEQIAAVAPRNHGLTIRKIEAEPGNNVTCIGLGWLSIVMDTVTSLDDDDDKLSQQQKQQQNPKRHHHHKDVNDDNDLTEPANNSLTPEEVPPRPSRETLAAARAAAGRAVHFSHKVAEHMQQNASWMFHNLQDDFPRRTWASAQRILHQVPVTVDRTTGFVKKMAQRLLNDDYRDDNDDDDNDNRRM